MTVHTMPARNGADDNVRTMHLLGGRRVTVADLLAANLIEAGAELRFVRARIGVTYHAKVTEDGRIRLQPDGREYRSPSRAAMVAAGMRAVDGWRAWQVVKQRRFLDAVRQELLDHVILDVAEAANQQSAQAAQQRIHERLRLSRSKADQGQPERFTVRELLALWGATDRGDHISQIEADLANHGLVTSPSFRAVTLDATIVLTIPPVETEEPSLNVDDLPSGDEDEPSLNVGLKVGNLAPLGHVESVSPNATFDEAITKMLLNDFSQLAVLNGPRNLRGAVTWRSIAQARHKNSAATLADAIEEHVEAVAYDRDLMDVLPMLQQRGYLFIRNEHNVVAGIVTTADVVERYGILATPFFQLGELDQTLRWILNRTCDLETVKSICNRAVNGFDELSMGDYQRILENKEVWSRLGWPLDRAAFIARLQQIRLIRNKVMHFHPDPLQPDAVEKLRRFNSLLHRYREASPGV
jgi:CBS domain-containing protein